MKRRKASIVLIIFQYSIIEKEWRLNQERKILRKCLNTIFWKRKKDINIQKWKSYPGVGKIIDMARDMVENGNKDNIDDAVS